MYQEPERDAQKFSCPNCSAVSQQSWFSLDQASGVISQLVRHIYYDYRQNVHDYAQNAISDFVESFGGTLRKELANFIPGDFAVSTCHSCSESALWIGNTLVHPRAISVDLPNADMDDAIKALYVEAATVYPESPKGAAALLRLALQQLLIQIGKPGKNINNDIKELVQEGLSVKIQQALDLLRVVGNNAVHPGQISFDDDKEVALQMFRILNVIADELISKPREIDNLYNEIIPAETREHIEERDGNKGDT